MNTCSLDDMIDGSACIDNLSDKEKLAASVYYLCAAVQGCSGEHSDCTVDGLQEEVKCLARQSPEKLLSIGTYSDKLAALAAGASLDGTSDELQEGIKCLKGLDDIQLAAMQILLRCQLRDCLDPVG